MSGSWIDGQAREFFASGRAIDLVLLVIGLEVVVLFGWKKRSGLSPLDVVGQLLSGTFLLLALRCALTGADYRLTALFVSASFPAHLFDLMRRARRRA